MRLGMASFAVALVACVVAGCSSSSSSSSPASPAGGGPDASTVVLPTTPVEITPPPNSLYQAEPTVAVAPDGTVAVAWLDLEPSTAMLGVAFSKDRGDTWDATELVALPDARFPSNEILVADAQSNFYLVTLGVTADQSTSGVFVAEAQSGSEKFGTFIQASDPALLLPRDASAMAIGQDQSLDVVYVEYADNTYQRATVVTSRSTDGGATWTRTPLSDPQGTAAWTNTCASKTSGKVAAAYLIGEREIDLRWSDDNGATWPSANENKIELDEGTGEFPSCLADGADLWVMQGVTQGQASATVEPTLDQIYLFHSGDGGKTFDPQIAVQDPAAGPKYMRALATVDGDGALSLVYYAGAADNDTAATVRHSRSLDRGKTFGASEVLYSPIKLTTSRAGNDWLGDLLGGASDAKNTFVTFVDNASGTSHVRFTRLTP